MKEKTRKKAVDMKTKQIIEGQTKLIVPDTDEIPEKAKVFYNDKMSTNRTLSVLVLKTLAEKDWKIADILSGLGARAVRYANEIPNVEVFSNDIQPSAVKLAEKNAELNNVKVKTSICEANKFLFDNKHEKFNFIDIDPFGSPAGFINSSLIALNPNKGVLGITATDTGTVAGIYPKACFRKYNTVSERTTFVHELGLRNLIAMVSKEASKYEYSIKPLFSYNHIHYDRLFIEIQGGRKTTNRELKNLGYIKYCKKCERREMIPIFENIDSKCECGEKASILGITWIGKIADLEFLDKFSKNTGEISYDRKAISFVKSSESEYSVEMPYYSVSALSRTMKKHNKKMIDIIEILRNKGYKAYGTHFDGQGLKTNAPFDELKKAVFE